MDYFILEVLAYREASLLGSSRSFQAALVEGDSLQMINAIKGHSSFLSIRGVINDIFCLVFSRNLSLLCVNRRRNIAAHTLIRNTC